jgi:DNA-binding beta-propeller fold protein YncE
MNDSHVLRTGISVVSAIALVLSGAASAKAEDPDPGRTLTGVSTPFGLAVHPLDRSIYVANNGGGVDASVKVFEPRSTTPNEARTLRGVDGATSVAIHPGTGDVYVAAYFANTIFGFDAGSTTPNPAKTRTVANPWDMEFDVHGNLIVTSYLANRLLVFEPGATSPTREVALTWPPMGVAVHPVTGDVYVGNAGLGTVAVFTAGSLVPEPAKALTGAGDGVFIAVDRPSGRVLVSEGGSGVVRVFENGSLVPAAGAELLGVGAPRGVATDEETGEAYVADMAGDRVLVYPGPTMALAAVTPAAGPVTGGTAVTITGASLGAVTGVSFGGVAATNVVAVSPTTVTAVAPAHAVGKVDVSVSWGGKTAGLAQAFTYTPVAPGKATSVSGAPGNGQVTVSWTAPGDTGGVPVASYTVTPTPAGPACATTATSCAIAGLTNGTKYKFVVRTTNAANLSTDSEASAAVTPYVPIKQKVKAKKASSKLPRKGFTTVVNWVKKPSYASRVMTATCADGTGRATGQLCRIHSYKTGKVKVRTKGYRNVQVTVTLQLIPKVGAPVQYGPSATWTRTWRVR